MGCGFCVVVPHDDADAAVELLGRHHPGTRRDRPDHDRHRRRRAPEAGPDRPSRRGLQARLRSAVAPLAAVLAGACAPAAVANPVVPGDHPDPSILQDGERLVRHLDLGRLAARPSRCCTRATCVHWRQVGSVLRAAAALGQRTTSGRPELVRRDGRVLAYYAALARNGRRCVAGASAPRAARPVPRPRAAPLQPRPARSTRSRSRTSRAPTGSSGSATATAAAGPTPILAAPLAPGGMSLAGAAAGAVPRRRAAGSGGPSRRPRSCATAATSTSSTPPGTAAAATATTRPAWRARAVAPRARGRSAAGPILRGGGGIRCPGHVGVTARARTARRSSPTTPTCAAIPSNRQLLHGPAPLRRRRAGRAVARATARRPAPPPSASSSPELSPGWQWPAGPRPRSRASRRRARARPRRAGAADRHDPLQRQHGGAGRGPRGAGPGLAVTGSDGQRRGGRAARRAGGGVARR